MKKLAFFLFVSLLFCVITVGCSSENCNFALGSLFPIDPPEPPVPPTPRVVDIQGVVLNPALDAPNGRPVPGVEVGYYDADGDFQRLGYTNSDGEFIVTVNCSPVGKVDLNFRKLGYGEDKGYGYTFDTLHLTFDSESHPIYSDKPILAYLNICSDLSIDSKTILEFDSGSLVGDLLQGSYAAFSLSPDEEYMYVADSDNVATNPTKKIARIKMETLYSSAPKVEYIVGKLPNGTTHSYNQPRGIVFSKDGDTMYIGEWNGSKILKFTGLKSAPVDTLSGGELVYNCFILAGTGQTGGLSTDGKGVLARFNRIAQIVLADDGNIKDDILYVADSYDHTIRKITGVSTAIDGTTADVTTIAGAHLNSTSGTQVDGPALPTARFNQPYALVLSKDQKTLYIGEGEGSRLRKLTNLDTPSNSEVVSLAGTVRNSGVDPLKYGDTPIKGNTAVFFAVFAIALSADEDVMFISDCGLPYGATDPPGHDTKNCKIKKVTGLKSALTSDDTLVSVFAGTGDYAFTDGEDGDIEIGFAGGLLLDSKNTVMYFFERYNKNLRSIQPAESP